MVFGRSSVKVRKLFVNHQNIWNIWNIVQPQQFTSRTQNKTSGTSGLGCRLGAWTTRRAAATRGRRRGAGVGRHRGAGALRRAGLRVAAVESEADHAQSCGVGAIFR